MGQSNNLHVRDAHDSERDAIREMTLIAYEEYAVVVPPPVWQGYRRQLLASLDQEEPEHIVAERNGVIVGSVLLYPPAANAYVAVAGTTESVTCPEVRLLAVLPAERGQGVATALMAECERRARRTGATALGLHTTDIMQVAMRMYERMGFVRVPELDFRPTESVLIKGYRRSLDNSTSNTQ